jgi:polysaccharide biosynthesis/export protein
MKNFQPSSIFALIASSLLAGFAFAQSTATSNTLVQPVGTPPAQSTTAIPEATRAAALPGTDQEPEYRIGPQTLIEVTVYGLPEMTRTARVNGRGQFSMPLIGTVDSLGLTASELERRIAAMLGEKYLQNPQVSVFVKEVPIQKFTIEGAVGRSGVFPLQGNVTLLRAIAIAGGPAQMADITQVVMFRSNQAGARESTIHDIEKIRAGAAIDPAVQDDDLIVVNRSKARAALKDSLFRDILDTINPLPFLR